jgi:hypothetical protein
VAWIDQVVPFLRSMTGPVAVQMVADGQERLAKKPPASLRGLGVVAMDQVVPFHVSARARFWAAFLR